MSKSSTGSLLLALAASTAVLYGIFTLIPKIKTDELLPALTEEETLKVLKAFLDKVRADSKRFEVGFNNIKQQIVASGQELEDRKIMEQFIFPHFKSGFKLKPPFNTPFSQIIFKHFPSLY